MVSARGRFLRGVAERGLSGPSLSSGTEEFKLVRRIRFLAAALALEVAPAGVEVGEEDDDPGALTAQAAVMLEFREPRALIMFDVVQGVEGKNHMHGPLRKIGWRSCDLSAVSESRSG